MGQGWYFGKPMTAEQTRELLAARSRHDPQTVSTAVNG
jgi:EAL domain-containing protein (putative c-di-GMP-specific phosphodiesterase class I)